MYNFIFKFYPQPWHFQLDLFDYPCGKDIYDNALLNVWKVFEKKTEKKKKTLAKKAPNIFWVQVKNINISEIF